VTRRIVAQGIVAAGLIYGLVVTTLVGLAGLQ
jgi:hypothetical protein